MAVTLWLALAGILAVIYKFVIEPRFNRKQQDETSSASIYKHTIRLATDSFSGYCLLRSDGVRDDLRGQGIKLAITDDHADYSARLKALRDGETDLAVFTIDALMSAGAQQGDFPATIVMLIDETKGADAVVAWKDGLQSIQGLNSPRARIICTPSSPSEFLARTVIAHFNLPNLPKDWKVDADGAKSVYEKFRSADRRQPVAYVLWEPYVSLAKRESGATVLLDSSRLQGYIIDVLVAQRQFLIDHPDLVRLVIEAHLRAVWTHANSDRGMIDEVIADANNSGADPLDDALAAELVKGIQWKNTTENYAHFGLLGAQPGISYLEETIANINEVLLKTGVYAQDPLAGKSTSIYFDGIMRDLQKSDFHPGSKLNLIKGMASTAAEQARTAKELPALSEGQWSGLAQVGELRVEAISFARGAARLTIQSERDLKKLAQQLRSFPKFYVKIAGRARAEGDSDANLQLARERAQAAADALLAQGVHANRLRTYAQPAPAGDSSGEQQSVTFMVGQVPY
jgi:outer membrane protein OmpA-like peptidoglycan-associated protein